MLWVHPQPRFLWRFDKNYLWLIIKYHQICTLFLLLEDWFASLLFANDILNRFSHNEVHRITRHLSRVMRKPTFWFKTWSDTNQTVQLLKMARGLKFRIKKVEELYCLCSENKGADQLRGYREADLRLCFRICKMLVFTWRGSFLLARENLLDRQSAF